MTTGVNASASDRTALVNGLDGGTETRASVLQKGFGGNFVNGEMVLAFISSPEYRVSLRPALDLCFVVRAHNENRQVLGFRLNGIVAFRADRATISPIAPPSFRPNVNPPPVDWFAVDLL